MKMTSEKNARHDMTSQDGPYIWMIMYSAYLKEASIAITILREKLQTFDIEFSSNFPWGTALLHVPPTFWRLLEVKNNANSYYD